MKIEVKESTLVKPMPAKGRSTMRISNLDAAFPETYHTRTLSFYRSTGAADFFNTTVLKAALARTLSVFYPIAGRLKKEKDRVEIDCNGEGAIFIEAEADGELSDLGDFGPRPNIGLVPEVDYSQGISSFPLLLVQFFGVELGGDNFGQTCIPGFATGDPISITTWCDIARGLDISVPPYLDRRVLAARNPPQTKFHHLEFRPPPPPPPYSNAAVVSDQIRKYSVLKLTREQLNILKASCEEDDGIGNTSFYTSFELLTGHAWECLCKARRLPKDQETRLYIMVDGRSRLWPPLPPGYFGNAVFKATHTALSGEVESNPLKFTVTKIHDALARMDDEYMRSDIDYLEVEGDLPFNARGTGLYNSPNLGITSWARMPVYDVDFGWGGPFFAGPASFPSMGI
ncbi:hypothetical protein C2S53_011362 [Perilla frutescens var. hirtella]|uniref:Uncharacterized protein n=1 Tax=Perilla frutescens var. hirtella TaxID=608512 RepID=A0AAD4P6Z4_PERFH|nr:hypothetical protein C2S53_011362 [Perilla frutescens var. hirtella]